MLAKKESLVKVLWNKETAHNFGCATDTLVAKVTIFIEVRPGVTGGLSLSSPAPTAGQAKDQTGIEMGGGGGMGVDDFDDSSEGAAKATLCPAPLNPAVAATRTPTWAKNASEIKVAT